MHLFGGSQIQYKIMPSNFTIVLGKNFAARLSKDVFEIMKKNIQLSVTVYLLTIYENNFTTERKLMQAKLLYLMANTVWEILVPQICTDFYDWENRICIRKLLSNLFQTSDNKYCIKQNVYIY